MCDETSASSSAHIEGQIVKNNKLAMRNLEAKHSNHVLFYLNQALIACKSLGNGPGHDRLLALTYNNLACYFQSLKNSEKALDFLFKSVELMSVEKDYANLAGSHLNICLILSGQNQHERALRHALKCLYILKGRDDCAIYLARAFLAAGTQYKILHQLQDAADCFKKGLALARKKIGAKHEITCKLQQALGENIKKETSRSRDIGKVLRKFTPVISKKYRENHRYTPMEKTVGFPDLKIFNKLETGGSLNLSGKKGKIDANLHRAQEKLAATTIQAYWKGYLGRKKYTQKKLEKQIKIAEIRAKLAVDQANKLKRRVIGKASRPVKSPLINTEIEKEVQALIKIQSTVKMFIQKKRYQKQLKACIKIQRFFKALGYMKLFQKIRSAACFIQYTYRKYKKVAK